MENNTGNKSKRPGLIRQPRVVPELQEKKDIIEQKEEKIPKVKNSEENTSKKVNKNQERNIKISIETKKQLDVLLKFSGHKFAYELIDSMIDVYIDTALDPDKRRAFKTLYKMMND